MMKHRWQRAFEKRGSIYFPSRERFCRASQRLIVGMVAIAVTARPVRCEPKVDSPLVFVDSYVATSQSGYEGSYRPYFTQASVDNEPRVNLAALGGSYRIDDYRLRLIGQWGDSVSRNYAGEPKEALRYIQEGYISRAITDRVLVDLGVFASHLGSEGWISASNLTYTRSFIAEFSPYYESGLRLKYHMNDQVAGEVLIVNGWQNISDERHPALGTRFEWKGGERSVVSSAFLGGEAGGTRSFHDLTFSQGFSSGATIVASADVGYQSAPDGRTGAWWGYSLVGRVPISSKVSVSSRAEFYSDPHRIIVPTTTGSSFSASGVSGGVGVSVTRDVVSRAEVRYLFSGDEVFESNDGPSKSDTIYVLSLVFHLKKDERL